MAEGEILAVGEIRVNKGEILFLKICLQWDKGE